MQATRARAAARARDSREELAQRLAQAQCAENVLAQAKLDQWLAQGNRESKPAQAWTFYPAVIISWVFLRRVLVTKHAYFGPIQTKS